MIEHVIQTLKKVQIGWGLDAVIVKLPSQGLNLVQSVGNVPQADASKKGFTTELTFGIAGTVVTDEYVCKVSYAEPGHDLVTKEVHHAIYSTIGNASAPVGVGPMAPRDAIQIVIRQVIGKSLEEIDEASDLAQ
ncbi:hypothetical protein [Paraburkholderia ferrariae]|uniref:Uncharacterized protein n=1 Tax=Paraburkholderia ferrariae TaxID=386056 RepID=A0ABU9RMC1_9BURK